MALSGGENPFIAQHSLWICWIALGLFVLMEVLINIFRTGKISHHKFWLIWVALVILIYISKDISWYVAITFPLTSWLWASFYSQTRMLAWQLWIAAWMQLRLAMWMTCARGCALNTFQLASNPLPNPVCATGLNATRPCAGFSTGYLPTTRTDCSSAPVRTLRARSVEDRPLCQAVPMKVGKNLVVLHRRRFVMQIMCAG